jgi:hypothetical protein
MEYLPKQLADFDGFFELLALEHLKENFTNPIFLLFFRQIFPNFKNKLDSGAFYIHFVVVNQLNRLKRLNSYAPCPKYKSTHNPKANSH